MPWAMLAAGVLPAEASSRLRGRSVVLLVAGQATAAAAMLQLDGLVRRMVLYPPDLSSDHLASVALRAEAEVILCDGIIAFDPPLGVDVLPVHADGDLRLPAVPAGDHQDRPDDQEPACATEWILLTSGTTGAPKLVLHTLASLTAAIAGPIARTSASPMPSAQAAPPVWSTFYDIRRYGGLQIFLRAALTGCSLVPGAQDEPLSGFLLRAAAAGVTHISGTPSHWRRALMHPEAAAIHPQYVRLSGEIADAAILRQLRVQYPQARIAHAFASTEAGVVFEVNDGAMGLPALTLTGNPAIDMRLDEGTLRVRSQGTAARYLGAESPQLRDAQGWVDTGDVLEERDGRFYFVGRRDGTINVGGQKVHPEEVEAVINRHPEVRMSLVSTRRNPIMGAVVTAEVVLKGADESAAAGPEIWKREILTLCRAELPRHKVPVAIRFVPELPVAASGKLVRRHA